MLFFDDGDDGDNVSDNNDNGTNYSSSGGHGNDMRCRGKGKEGNTQQST